MSKSSSPAAPAASAGAVVAGAVVAGAVVAGAVVAGGSELLEMSETRGRAPSSSREKSLWRMGQQFFFLQS